MSAQPNLNELLLEGQLPAAVESCKQSIRIQPSQIEPRVALYELSVFLGDWDRCNNQVETIMSLGGDPLHWLGHMADIHAAKARKECWAGRVRPPVIGECDDDDQFMIRCLWRAIVKAAAADHSLTVKNAEQYGGMVFGPGKINGVEFNELSTVDSRLPGILEITEGGEYAWLWMGAVSRIEMQGGAKNLTEVMWIPSRIFLTNGDVKSVSIFGLYPDTENSINPMVVLGRETEWDDTHQELAIGKGGQLLYMDDQPVAFQQIRLIEFEISENPVSMETESPA